LGEVKFYRGEAATAICDILRTEILTLQLEPGSALDETSLSVRFNVSRSPIREALNRLLVERLITASPNRSAIVAPVDIRNFPKFIQALDIQQRFATRLAAQNRTEEDITTMRVLAKNYNDSVKSDQPIKILGANFDFHYFIGKASANRYVEQQYGELLSLARRMLHIHIKYLDEMNDRSPLQDQHFDIIHAIESQNIEMADQLAHEHTMQFHDRFLAALHYYPSNKFDIQTTQKIGAKDCL